MSNRAQVPAIVARYFGNESTHPVIVQVYYPTRGWRAQSLRKRVSLSWARKLRQEGATQVALSANGRRADFRIEEILRRER